MRKIADDRTGTENGYGVGVIKNQLLLLILVCIINNFFSSKNLGSEKKFVYLQPKNNLKEEKMARPIRETPVLKDEDAFNFEWRRLMVDHLSEEERAENRRKLDEQVAEADKNIEWCW